jgi:3-oxoacyl-[acyl-carrier protein] reductase
MSIRFDNRVAIITGAGTGLGRTHALALAARGAKVVVNDLGGARDGTGRSSEAAQKVVDEIRAAGGEAIANGANVAVYEEVEAMVAQAMDAWGRVDILVNNAGGSRAFKELHVSEDAWQEAINLNFHRPRQLADALIDQMIDRKWGRIVNITGKSEPQHINGAVCAKAGMHSWAKGLSRMVGKHGVTVNCIAPGRINSEQILRNYTPEFRAWQSEHEIPVGRYGEPAELANLVTFLVSPLAAYITGTVIPVDGGLRRYQF